MLFALASWPVAAWATPPLYTPFPCGTTYDVTQAHNGGSHTDECAWAWDIGIPEGADVASPADGVVRLVRMDSTSGGCSSAYGNDANYVVVDFGDGTEALFLHLAPNSSSFAVGDPVSQGDVVGRVGLTGWVCGAHLHFQIQQTCASWWCQSIPATFVDYGDPAVGTTLASNNCPPVVPCTAVADGGETIIDERTECFEQLTSYWWNVPEGYEDHHYYTKATDAPAAETIGRWRFDVAVAGTYRVDVFVPETHADSIGALYGVDGGSGLLAFGPIDQSTDKGWITLGDVELAVGAERFVELGDNTGEATSLDRHLAYDAVRLTFVPEPSGAGGGSATGATASSGATGSASAGTGAGDEGGGDTAADEGAEDAGCSCRHGSSTDTPAVTLLLLMLLARRRRR
jgi:MYXO-CTERM domain-containing protein